MPSSVMRNLANAIYLFSSRGNPLQPTCRKATWESYSQNGEGDISDLGDSGQEDEDEDIYEIADVNTSTSPFTLFSHPNNEEQGHARRPRHRRYRLLHSRAQRRRRRRDITQWGYYRETAPPVLPVDVAGPFDTFALFWEAIRSLAQRVDDDHEHSRGRGDPEGDNEDGDDNEVGQEGEDATRLQRLPGSFGATNPFTVLRRRLGFGSLRDLAEGRGDEAEQAGAGSTPASSRPTQSQGRLTLTSSISTTTTSVTRATEPDSRNVSGRLRRAPINSNSTMAVKTHWWISAWFLLSAPVIFWDVGYCFMRPRSMAGGDLHWIWKPYEIYQEIDYIYGIKALQENNGFTNAQSLLNIVETLFNLLYVYLAHVTQSPVAPLVGFVSASMTVAKTVLYWAQEYFCGGCAIGHNNLSDLFVYWVIPNGLWIIIPSIVIYQLYSDLAGSLRLAERLSSNKKKN